PPARTTVPPWVSLAAGVAGLVFLGALLVAASGNKEAIGVIFTGPLLVAITWFIAKRLAIIDRNPEIVPILMGGVCVKLIGSLVRSQVASGVYGTGDFLDYDKWGRRVAAGLRHGHLINLPGRLAGTNFMRLVTGFIYFATPTRMLSGFLVYGFLSFVGL